MTDARGARHHDTLASLRLALELMRRIPRTGRIDAPTLHRQLEAAGLDCTLRTVQRTLGMLCEHFDIECDASSKPYGYRWKENARALVAGDLGPQQALVLALARGQLERLLPPAVLRSLDPLFRAARHVLDPMGTRSAETGWLRKVRVIDTTLPLEPAPIADGVLEQVGEALYADRWLDVTYRNANDYEQHARVMPLGLAQQGPRMYLACRFQGYGDTRTLSIHRIRSAQATALTFERPADFDLARYDAEGRFAFGAGRRIRLAFSIDKRAGLHLLESKLAADQTHADRGDHYRITATVVQSALLERWLQSFGDEVWSVRTTKVGASAAGRKN